jgi:activator of HSP90 ATPase
MKTSTIIQEVDFNATPSEVYNALMNSDIHTEFTGDQAFIGDKPGDAYSAYGGYIEGEIIELIPGEKIVQTWAPFEDGWPEDHFSKVTFEFTSTPTGTHLHFVQEDVPEDMEETFTKGWEDFYWTPMQEMFDSK